MSSKPIPLKMLLLILLPTGLPSCALDANQAFCISSSLSDTEQKPQPLASWLLPPGVNWAPGVGPPNGLRRCEFQSSEILVFGFSTTSKKKHSFSKTHLDESLCRKCSWRAYATFHRRISCYLSRWSVFFLESPLLFLILCAYFELGAECLPLGDLWLPGSGLKGRQLPLGFHLRV